MWYIDETGPRHVCGYGTSPRAAHADAWRLRRQVANHGSRIAAAEFARSRIKQIAFKDVADERALRQLELAG